MRPIGLLAAFTRAGELTELRGPHEAPGVAFAGHLLGPVDGIDVPSTLPAEIVRRAYARWGASAFSRLEGNFAVCVFDPSIPGIVATTDAGGTLPLYHVRNSLTVVATSPLEALRAAGMPRRVDTNALHRYLVHGSVAGAERTPFLGVRELLVGHILEAGVEGSRTRAMDDGIAAGPRSSRTLDEASADFRDLVTRAVGLQLEPGRTGLALSGGLDSSCLAAALRTCAGTGEPLHAFCYAQPHYPSPEDDEPAWALQVADHLGFQLHRVELASEAIPAAMTRSAHEHELPFASPVILAQAEVFRAASRAGVDTMLSGLGPDYLFGGGASHVRARAFGLLRQGRVGQAVSFARGASAYAGTNALDVLTGSVRQAVGSLATTGPGLKDIISDQLRHSKLPSVLRWEGYSAQAGAVQNRWPYLVSSILRFASRLPDDQLVTDRGETRPILRRAFRGFLPDAILERPRSIGFAVPAISWLQEQRDWAQQRLAEAAALPIDGDRPTVGPVVGPSAPGPASWQAAYRAWRWISLVEWARAHEVGFQ